MGVTVAAGGPPPSPPSHSCPSFATLSGPQDGMGRVADGLGWMGWPPICPLPLHCPQSQGGWEGVVVHCSLDPPLPSSWRELRSLLPWRQRRGRGMQGDTGVRQRSTPSTCQATYTHITQVYIPQHPWNQM